MLIGGGGGGGGGGGVGGGGAGRMRLGLGLGVLVVDIREGGGNTKERVPDFRFPEVGISDVVQRIRVFG